MTHLDNQIHYELSCDTEFYCKLTLGNSSVAVGEAAGGGDEQEWEIIDGYNGQQLHFVRITDDHTTPASIWPDLMVKAHHHLLELHRLAREQAARDADCRKLYETLEVQLATCRIILDRTGWVGLTDAQHQELKSAVTSAEDLYDHLDHIIDPDEELLLTEPVE